MNNNGRIAITEILILVIGMIAFAYIAGIGSLPLVSAAGQVCGGPQDPPCPSGEECKDTRCIKTLEGGVQAAAGLVGIGAPLATNFLNKQPVAITPVAGGKSADELADEFLNQLLLEDEAAQVQKWLNDKELEKVKEWLDQQSNMPANVRETISDELKYRQTIEPAGEVPPLSDAEKARIQQWRKEMKMGNPGGITAGRGWAAVGNGVLWGIGVGFAAYEFSQWFGQSEKQAQAIGISLGLGMAVGKTIYNLGKIPGVEKTAWFAKPGVAFGIGVGVAAVAFLLLYQREKTRKISFSCNLWDAPIGGQHCEECNEIKGFPCSEYQCKSLGQGCQLLNQGTKEERCAWNNSNDVSAPVINTWTVPLTTGYRYTPDNVTNPPDRGVIILNLGTSDGCVPAFTPLVFGIQTDEPARCKIGTLRQNFSELPYFFGGTSIFAYNHTQTMAMPGAVNVEQEGANATLENDGEMSLYVKCQDANGNSNDADLVFKFCVDKGPDNTAPVIVETSILNNMPVAVGQDEVDLNVYINEPAECKWSTMDRNYEQMENVMDCSKADSLTDATEINSRLVYTCSTTLTGIKDKTENNFYFKCKDQPKLTDGTRNENAESYLFTVFGTETLVIDEAGPSETVRDSTTAVKVTLSANTSGGFKEGESLCYFKDKDSNDENYVEFFNTGSYTHSTDLYLEEDDYQYIIKCVDLGGNADTWQVNFSVESDSDAPIITRAYKEENYLKIVTDENSTCVYDTSSCSYLFEDGLPMTAGTERINHFVTWSTQNKFYIKCKDDFGNQPPTDECNAIVRPI